MPHTDPDLRVLHKDDLRALLAEAAEAGAEKALAAIGLDYGSAEKVRLLLNLADAIKTMKREIWRQIARAVFTAVLVAIVAKIFGSQVAAFFFGKGVIGQ